MLIKTAYLVLLFGVIFADCKRATVPGLVLNCGPQQCRGDGVIICGQLGTNYRIFPDSCERRAHYCETGENYTPIPIENCPQQAYNWPFPCRKDDDPVCATADDENFAIFKNYCDYNNFLMTVRRVYWMVPLKNCYGLPDMPTQACSKIGQPSSGQICAFDGTTYQIFQDLSHLRQEKCFINGNWRKVSMIYC